MKTRKTLLIVQLVLLGIITNLSVYSQKIDVDSLLHVTIKDINTSKNHELTKKKCQLGIKLAPDYLDFHLLLGKVYQLTNANDSARFYYKHIIAKDSTYEDAYKNLINIEIQEENYNEAETLLNEAITKYSNNKYFQLKKLDIYHLQKEDKKEIQYLAYLELLYPDDNDVKQRKFLLDLKNKNDRLGINYSYTVFDRDGYGPWHLLRLQYIRERKWGSIIGSVNYGNRYLNGVSITNGIQYEIESYFFTGKKSYSYIDVALSNDIIFPKIKLGYSYFQNFNNGWEADIGVRYTNTENSEFKTLVLGLGKYINSYWINVRTYIQNEDKEIYHAYTLTARYYFNTRFDYVALLLGYGTSPDERNTLMQYEQRVALESYRIGTGYFKLFKKHYLFGLQFMYNNQEYAPNKKQNEYETSLLLQYKF